MKKLSLALAALAMMVIPVSADTVPSTFDPGCNVNWIGGGCGERMVGSGPSPRAVKEPREREPEPCDPKETKQS